MTGFHPSELIKEIKERPGIYNKEELEQPRREHKYRLWMEVAERLTPSEDWEIYTTEEKEARVDEIQLKWKHMRDHFYREIKLHSMGKGSMKRKYVYFDAMEFMRPFVGFKLPNRQKRMSQEGDSDEELDEVDEMQTECLNGILQEEMDEDANAMQMQTNMNDEIEVAEETITTQEHPEELLIEAKRKRGKQTRSKLDTPSINKPKSSSSSSSSPTNRTMYGRVRKAKTNKIVHNGDVQRKVTGSGSSKVNSHQTNERTPTTTATKNALHTFKLRDGDISFCLSLVPSLRKLMESSKLRAKIEILKVLQKFMEATEKAAPRKVENGTGKLIQDEYNLDDDSCVQVKNEHSFIYDENGHDDDGDPLNGCSGGNTKSWWT